MTEQRLAVIVPTRGRPENIRKVLDAWDFTNAWDHAHLVLAVDANDPEHQGYIDLFEGTRHPDTDEALFSLVSLDAWMPMVHKLNVVARNLAYAQKYEAIGFAGDDHLPRTIGWAARYLTVLGELGTGMVYGDDGYQGSKLSTEWAVTADVVRALDRMVPAAVEHMYCDNSMMDLFGGAGALRHLPEVRIEHMHPVVGKAASDDQYKRVNHRDQFRKDRAAYEAWRSSGMVTDIKTVRALRPGQPDVRPETRRRNPGSGPRPVSAPRGGPRMGRNSPFPRHFKQVRGATPPAIEVTLADFASQVPADQGIVELGVFQGKTSLVLAWGASQGYGAHVTGVDAWDLEGNTYDPPFTDAGSERWARHWVQNFGYQNRITLIKGFAVDVALAVPGGPKVGLLFVDDDHSAEGARAAIEAWAPHLADGAIIAVDDYGHPDWPGVKETVDALVDEGFLEPVELFHDRLAVTRLADKKPTPVAITSEGVSPSPYPAMADQVADGPATPVDKAVLEREWEQVDPEGVAALRASAAALVDSEVSEDWAWKVTPEEAVALTIPAGPVADLNTGQLRALAKHRGIVLGARKDKRSDMLQALKDGR